MASSTPTGSITIRSLLDAVRTAARVRIWRSLYNSCSTTSIRSFGRLSAASGISWSVPRFGSSGIRGIGNVDVTPDLALRVGMILGDQYGDTIIGRDPRITGPMLVQALGAGVLSAGASAIDAGLVSTPTLARGARDFACGAIIKASHNPAPYNGIKLWNPDGMAFDEEQQREVEDGLERGRFPPPTWDHTGVPSSRPDLVRDHVEAILKDVGLAKVRVVVDCACGATATITPFLLRQMGCEVLATNAQADGHFPGREPEPTEENLGILASTVRAGKADLGIAHDGDGDRMVAVIRGSIPFDPSRRAAIEPRLDGALGSIGADVTTVDGWRLQFDDGWSLVRFSGTEPKIRVMTESRDTARANEIYSTVLSSAKGAAA